MNVTVRLHATLRRPTPDGLQNRVTLELDDPATVALLLEALAVENPDHVMVLIGTRRVEQDHLLQDGDEVNLFPPISGG